MRIVDLDPLRMIFVDGVDTGRRYKNGDINDAITDCKGHEQRNLYRQS